ncbi:MAG: tRNA (guanosine(46)-N7)-methyltransferase TrmB [Ruminococcaceae bacterium]|nr:tRNA (guanosine(46)-N7)-methyltransferase TrmB [Oscillospiraceae bacterium]
MRMRKKKHSAERLAACEKYLFTTDKVMSDPAAQIGDGLGKVFLEIGAGKGGFACAMAQRHSDTAYFAMERVTDCVVLCAEKASSGEYGELNNLRFVIDTADNLMHIFAPGTVDAIFLNFSDPWSKKGYAKRRLTHRRYLAMYMNLLRDGGSINFKTDNALLFDFSLEEIEAMDLVPDVVTRDLHASEWNEGNIMTEYERNFSKQGMKINMLRLTKPASFNPEVSAEFLNKAVYRA